MVYAGFMETSTIYVSHALPLRGFARKLDRTLEAVPGLPLVGQHATRHMLALELCDDTFRWPVVLKGSDSRQALSALATKLASAFESSHAIITPSAGPGAGAAWDYFVSEITLQELLARLQARAGSCIQLRQDGKLSVPLDARVLGGYCVLWRGEELARDEAHALIAATSKRTG